MIIDGLRIYNDGVGIGPDGEDKIRQIMTLVRSVSDSADLGLRLLKSDSSYEALLWGNAAGVKVGAYHRGASLRRVFQALHRRVKRECSKVRKSTPQSRLGVAA